MNPDVAEDKKTDTTTEHEVWQGHCYLHLAQAEAIQNALLADNRDSAESWKGEGVDGVYWSEERRTALHDKLFNLLTQDM